MNGLLEKKVFCGSLSLKYELKHFVCGYGIANTDIAFDSNFHGRLHSSELRYSETLKFPNRKLSYLSGRIAAKEALSALLPDVAQNSFPIDEGVFKFPVVKGLANTQVSISHSQRMAAALAFPEEHPLGIDIEKADVKNLDVFRSHISDQELSLILDSTLSEVLRYNMLWTMKEALSKVIKTGLTINFKLLEINSLEKTGDQYLGSFSNFDQYKAISCSIGDYACSIVLPLYTEADTEEFWKCLKEAILKH